MSENVKKMLDIVKSPKKTPMIVNPKPKRVVCLASDTSIHNVGEGNFSIQKMGVSSLVSRQPYNVVRYISYVPHIQLEGIKHEEIHRDAN